MNKMISCIKKYSERVRNETNNTTGKWANVIKKGNLQKKFKWKTNMKKLNLTSNQRIQSFFNTAFYPSDGKNFYMSLNVKCWPEHKEICSHALLLGA